MYNLTNMLASCTVLSLCLLINFFLTFKIQLKLRYTCLHHELRICFNTLFTSMFPMFWTDWCCFNRYECPDHVNPAEFLADLISVDYSSSASVYASEKRIDGLIESFSQQSSTVLYATPIAIKDISKNVVKVSKKNMVKKKGGWWRQFWLLLGRAWMQVNFLSPLWVFNICSY